MSKRWGHYEYQTNDEYGCHTVRGRVDLDPPGIVSGIGKGLAVAGAFCANPLLGALALVGAVLSSAPNPYDDDMSEADWNASRKKGR